MKARIFIVLMLVSCWVQSQNGWQWTVLPPMPEAVANNAVSSAIANDTLCVYSFGGIDESLEPSGIHLRSYKFNTQSGVWTQVDDIPDTQGKIAAGASSVNGKIYVAGGYYVEENFSETSSDDLHIFDPSSSLWLSDAAAIPIPIDDHVQVVYRDSLIYLITGWSNTGNVSAVQVYDTYFDSWEEGTPVPSNTAYRVFGASGGIVGDTIYYAGGVRSSGQFTAGNRMRKGVIEEDPLEITWSLLDESPGEAIYRSAVLQKDESLYWLGGAGVAYNFDGLAYSNNAAVSPVPRIIRFDASESLWTEGEPSPFGVMDLRGSARISATQWIICGGLAQGPEVSDQTYLLSFDSSTPVTEQSRSSCISWKLTNQQISIHSSCGHVISSIVLFDESGRELERAVGPELNYPFSSPKLYFFHVLDPDNQVLSRTAFVSGT